MNKSCVSRDWQFLSSCTSDPSSVSLEQCTALFSLLCSRSPIQPGLFISVRFAFPHCIKSQVLFVHYLYFAHWCRGHMCCFSQPLSTYFFWRITGCHVCYCFSSNVILDVLCSIQFCGSSQHFFFTFVLSILSCHPHSLTPSTYTSFPF